MRTDIDIDIFKKKLLEEKELVTKELQGIGKQNPQNKSDWVPTESDVNQGETDPIDQADNLEELDANNAIIANLEARFNNIEAALKKIEEGTYGFCEISNEPIEVDRLEANPAAQTCKAHLAEQK